MSPTGDNTNGKQFPKNVILNTDPVANQEQSSPLRLPEMTIAF
jgi:hypothetical protein